LELDLELDLELGLELGLGPGPASVALKRHPTLTGRQPSRGQAISRSCAILPKDGSKLHRRVGISRPNHGQLAAGLNLFLLKP
jgi:hypothetical protein